MRIVGKIIDIILTRFICFLHEGITKYVSFISLHIYLPDKHASTDIDFDTFWVLIHSTICLLSTILSC
jgi:hypothetical protein